jgi:hypothetical protein
MQKVRHFDVVTNSSTKLLQTGRLSIPMIPSDSEDASTRFERLRSHHPATAAPLDARCTVDERQYQSTGRGAQLLHASLRVKKRYIERVGALQLAGGE